VPKPIPNWLSILLLGVITTVSVVGQDASFQSDDAMHVPPPATTVMAQLLPQLVNYRCCQNGRY